MLRRCANRYFGGGERDRTDDPLLAKQVLSQLSYTPRKIVVGLVGFEPTTPALSRRCSNRLSYRPAPTARAIRNARVDKVETHLKPSKRTPLVRILPSTTTDKSGRENLSASSRKEVIQPHLPIRLPCYDFTPVTNPAVVIALLAVRLTTSGRTRSHGVTGGVYKTRERIHRGKLIRDY